MPDVMTSTIEGEGDIHATCIGIISCMRHHDGTDDSAIEYAEWVRGDGLQRETGTTGRRPDCGWRPIGKYENVHKNKSAAAAGGVK